MASKDSGGGSWLDSLSNVSGSVGGAFGQSRAKRGSDWLDKKVAQDQQQAATNQAVRFQNGAGTRQAQANTVETDQSVGAKPGDPKVQAHQAAAQTGGGGITDWITSPMGMILMGGLGVGLFLYARG